MSTHLQKFFKFFYFLLICVTPFLFSNQFLASFEYPKFVLSVVVIEILSTAFWIINNVRVKSFKVDMWDILAVFWIFVLVGSSWRAGTLDYSFWGSPFRYQGIFTQIHLVVLFYITRRLISLIPEFQAFILRLVVGGALIQGTLILLQWTQFSFLKLDITTYSGRVFGTFGEPNFAAGYLAAGCGSLLGLNSKTSNKKIFVLSFLLLALAILATRSWGGILASICAGVFYMWKRFNLKKVKAIFLLMTAITFIIFIFLALDKEKITIQSNGFPRIESRLSIWPASFKLFVVRPLIGYGAENLNLVFPDELGGVYIDRAHNAFLDALIFGGVFLGSIYAVFTIASLVKAYKENFMVFLPFITILVRDMVNVSSIVNLMLFWLILGLIFSKNEDDLHVLDGSKNKG